MKKLIVVVIVTISCSLGCESVLPHPTLPKQTIACQSDWNCPESYICGFAHVDQYASCIYKPGSSHFSY